MLPLLCLLVALGACGRLDEPTLSFVNQPALPAADAWTLAYTGDCAGREDERITITRFDERAIAFGEFALLRGEGGDYIGSATFIAPMPVDGREIPYEIAYALRLNAAGGLLGSQTVIEGGGQGLSCPLALRYLGGS